MADWRIYERFVAGLMSEQVDNDATVIPNAKLIGHLSGIERQIDVLIDSRHDHNISRRIIVDAKRHKRPIDIKQVEEFEGMMKDVRAHRGVIVCTQGYTPAALRRAQDAITIRIVPLTDLESLDLMALEWCSHSSCNGLVLWDASSSLSVGGLWAIFVTSKCDECNRFNIWCWSCGERFALNDEDEYRCSCNGPWFWVTSIEDDSEGGTEQFNSVYLLLVYGLDQYAVVDRRPLR